MTDTSVTDLVQYRLDTGIATISLNKADQLNSFCKPLVEGIHHALDCAEEDHAAHIVFRAEGKGFSGGLDLSGLDDESNADLLMRLVRIELLLQRVRHHGCSTTALVHGACYGAAADLVLSCRSRIATDDARFLMPGMRFGIVLGTRRLRDTVGEVAAYQLLDRSKPFSAEEGLQAGFLTEIAGRDEWADVLSKHYKNLSHYTSDAYAYRVAQLTPDTRDSDMAALVGSVVSGSIKVRMQAYVAKIKAAKPKPSKI